MKLFKKSIFIILGPVLLGTFLQGCSQPPDISGKYLLLKCHDQKTGSDFYSVNTPSALHLKKFGKDGYIIEYIGGSTSGTKLNAELSGHSLSSKLGSKVIEFIISKDYNTVHIENEDITCLYTKIKNLTK